MGGVLEGVRVLDFGRYIAGPYCATLLAEFGAEVIRVEKRDGSEDRFVAPVAEGGEGALFLQINRNKKCITLDPMKPEGQEVMRRLVATADIVIANLPPQIVEGALLATALTFTNATLIEQAVIAANRVPTGNLGQTAAPADIYRTKDGWVLCQVTGQPLFVRWTRLMDEDGWLKDPRFADDLKRGENGAVISKRMASWCAERTTQEAVDILGAARIPAGPVLSPQQALEHPHIRAAGFLKDVDYPGLPNLAPVARAAVRLSQTPGEIVTRPPTLGEHTDLVLANLGYDSAAIATLREKGVI
jgi:crotonobetainyl-CoA:carnitine CoA-transferase CaiB-like acyl-CoA transferase